MTDESATQIRTLKGQLARYGMLSEAVLSIAGSPDLDRMLMGAVGKFKWVLEFDCCTLAMMNEKSEFYNLRTLFETRRDVTQASKRQVPLSQGIPGEVMRTNRMLLVGNIAENRDALPPAVDAAMEEREKGTVLSIPLRAYDQVFGSLTFRTEKVDGYGREDIKIAVSFATHLALGIDRWRQTRQLNDTNKSLQHEISDRMRVEEALRESEERYALSMRGSNDGLWDWDIRTNEVIVSSRLKTLIGLDSEDIKITPQHWQSRIHPSDLKPVLSALTAHLRGETDFFSSEFRAQRIDGQYGWVLQRGFALRDKSGWAYRVAGSLGDISDRKHAEFELMSAKERAETALTDLKEAQANLVHAEKMASLGQLTAGIAHEIKNPLNFVNNFADTSIELLEELRQAVDPSLATLDVDIREDAEDLFETLKSDLNTIANHGRRADGIVKNMLLHSRGSTSDHEPTDVNRLVEESLNLAYHGERARDSGFNIAIEHDFDPDAGSADLLPQEISRVLVNLLNNSFYATRKRKEATDSDYKPTVIVATRGVGEAVEIRVRDNGTGIPKQVQARLFSPFFSTKPTGEGTGLGLSLSYDIITQQHQGSISAESEEGGFTEFTICLPRQFGSASSRKERGTA